MTITPVNFRKQDASPAAIARDVTYALQIADFYLGRLPGGAARVLGRKLLEIGPGASLGTAVVLACHGAEVTVADRFLARWDPEYHGAFYRALLARLAAERDHLSPEPILSLLRAEAFGEPALTVLPAGIEDLGAVADHSFDVVLSNAVFEHVADVPRALATLARITRPGGHGVHQVDFRDHRDFARPLEFLTLPAEDFAALFADVAGECGNRWRPDALRGEAERAGFEALSFEPNLQAEGPYVEALLPRLHDDFRGLGPLALAVLSGCFVLRRRVALNTEYPQETDAPQTLAHSRCRYAFAAQFAPGRRVLDVGCGAGLGTRELLAAGAAEVTGVDLRPDALELARAHDPRGRWDDYVEHDLERPLPFDDGRFDLVVALEVLEHVRGQAALVAELRRVLSPDGVALVSVPNKAFEQFWTGLAGEENPYHVHVPDLDEFIELLSGFGWVDFFGQLDVVSSLVLPLDGNDRAVATGELKVQAGSSISDRGTVTVLALAFPRRPVSLPLQPPRAFAYGNYQDDFGGAIAHNQALAKYAEALLQEKFTAANKLRWAEVRGG